MSNTALTPGEMRTPTQKAYDALVLEHVKRGIKLLEERHGPSWVDKIDMRTLNLGDEAQCVLGQLYGDYTDGLEALDIEYVDDDHGADYSFDIGSYCGTYRELQACWEDVLTPKIISEE